MLDKWKNAKASGLWISLSSHPFFCLVQHVHGPLVDVPLQLGGGLLQLLQPLAGLAGVVALKVISSVGLAEELTLRLDPVVFLQHPRNLEEQRKAKRGRGGMFKRPDHAG